MKRFLLFAILALAATLRLWNLGSVPPSASMDEASIGYNAYSVLKTGGDEYGDFPLISQRSYDDWRRSTYLFLVLPFIALFDLNVIAIRLPAVLLSLLTVWATHQILVTIFSKQRETIALFATFLLAVSPWHIYISRLGHESNAYLTFFVFGVWFFFQGFANPYRLLFSLIFFTLAMVSYYAGQVLVPLFLFCLLFIYRRQLLSLVVRDKKILAALGMFTILLIPVVWAIFSPNAMVRFQGTSAFDFTQKKITNVKILVHNYVSHFSVGWLFTNSGRDQFKVPNLGLLYWWELPLILLGIFTLLRSRDLDTRAKRLLLVWLMLAPLPASVATQAPHAMRSYAFLPTWQIFSAFGLAWAVAKAKNYRTLLLFALAIISFVSLKSFSVNYYGVFPKQQSDSFHWALAQAIPSARSLEKNYEKIVFSNQDNLYQSYMLFLYYSRYDPRRYQELGGTQSGGFAETHTIGKYDFRPIRWEKDSQLKRTLLVGNPRDFPSDVAKLSEFAYLDGTVGVVIVERR